MTRVVIALTLACSVTSMAWAQTPPAQGAAVPAQGGGRQGRPAQPPQEPPAAFYSKSQPKNLVEFDMMTWPEVYHAIHDEGKTTALFYVGGTEHRGPQNVNGGHTLMARETVKAIALKLGNAIAMPVLAYSPNNASPQQTGTIGLTNEILSMMLERLAEQAIVNGFKNVVLMGDHGGGQPDAYASVAKKLDEKYAPQNIHVYFCDEVYAKAQGDFDKYLASIDLPVSPHAGIPDTSEMMYLGQGKDWVRVDLLPVAVGATGGRGQAADPNAPRPVASGVSGDGRQSSIESGQKAFQNKVDAAVAQIQRLIK